MFILIKQRNEDAYLMNCAKCLNSYAKVLFCLDSEFSAIDKSCLNECEVLITTIVTEKQLCALPKLKKIFLYKTGTDTLPVKYINERKIEIVPSHANSRMIAEHALTLILALLHRTPEFHNDLRNGLWYADGRDYQWTTLYSCDVGILGYGNIGKVLGEMLLNLAHSVSTTNRGKVYPSRIILYKNIDELIRNNDLIVLALPLNDSTINILDEARLAMLKGKYVVNVGRAGVYDEKIMYDLLSKKVIKGFASDVWLNKPDKTDKNKIVFPSSCPFEKLDNVLLSPHCATHGYGGHENYVKDAVMQCYNYVKKEVSCRV